MAQNIQKIAAIQMCSSTSIEENLNMASKLITEASECGAAIVVLPEMFALFGKFETDKVKAKEVYGSGRVQSFLASQSQQSNVWIIGGTIPIAANNDRKVRASCLVFNNEGRNISRYDKIHLFDVAVSKHESYCESNTTEPGSSLAVVPTSAGKIGLSVCYDLRFPGMYTQLAQMGAEIITVPSAFSAKTGEAHWDTLIRCRAIETQCYLVAACQSGHHENKRITHGHSAIVSPWGDIIAYSSREGNHILYCDIDLEYLYQVRRSMPILKHRKFKVLPL